MAWRRLSECESRFLAAFSSDCLSTLSIERDREGTQGNGIDVSYCEIPSSYGHDAFLLEEDAQTNLIKGFSHSPQERAMIW